MFLLLESCVCGHPFKFSPIFHIQAITGTLETSPTTRHVCLPWQSTLPSPELSWKSFPDRDHPSDLPNLSWSQCCSSHFIFLLIFPRFPASSLPDLQPPDNSCANVLAGNLKCFHNFINQTQLQYCNLFTPRFLQVGPLSQKMSEPLFMAVFPSHRERLGPYRHRTDAAQTKTITNSIKIPRGCERSGKGEPVTSSREGAADTALPWRR